MPFFDPVPRDPNARTPKWSQVTILLLGGIFVAAGGCAGAWLVFSSGYGGTSKTFVVLWWALMAVFMIGIVMLLVAFVFIVVIAVRAIVRTLRRA